MGGKNWGARLALKAAHGRDLLTKLRLNAALVLHIRCRTVHVQGSKSLKVRLLNGYDIVMAANLGACGKERQFLL